MVRCPLCETACEPDGTSTLEDALRSPAAYCEWEGHGTWRHAWFRTRAPQIRTEVPDAG